MSYSGPSNSQPNRSLTSSSRGIEALAHSRPSTTLDGASIALPLLFGFTFMLVVEQLSSSHAHQPHHHHHHHHKPRMGLGHHAARVASPDSIFDVELAGYEDGPDGASGAHERRVAASSSGASTTAETNAESDLPPSAYPITVGLVLHGLADGLALGMSMLSNNEPSSPSYALSLVVFLALAVHKGALPSKARLSPVAPH